MISLIYCFSIMQNTNTFFFFYQNQWLWTSTIGKLGVKVFLSDWDSKNNYNVKGQLRLDLIFPFFWFSTIFSIKFTLMFISYSFWFCLICFLDLLSFYQKQKEKKTCCFAIHLVKVSSGYLCPLYQMSRGGS